LTVGQTDVADLALLLQPDQSADRVFERHVRVAPMELIQGDMVQPQASQAALASLPQMFRSAVGMPLSGAGAYESTLGRDDQILRVRMERLGDELLAHVRAVGVRSVDEVDPELDGSAQHSAGLVSVGRIAPDASAGDAHGAEAEAVDRQVATNIDRSGVGRRCSVAWWHFGSSSH
jgi:hypothetical protein